MERKRLKVKTEPVAAHPSTCSTLTPELVISFCKLIRKGLPADAVCDYLGISSYRYYQWLRLGTEALRKLDEGTHENDILKDERIYVHFVQRFRRATARFRFRMIKELEAASGKEWIKYMAILERRDRRNFGRDEPVGGEDESFNPSDTFL